MGDSSVWTLARMFSVHRGTFGLHDPSPVGPAPDALRHDSSVSVNPTVTAGLRLVDVEQPRGLRGSSAPERLRPRVHRRGRAALLARHAHLHVVDRPARLLLRATHPTQRVRSCVDAPVACRRSVHMPPVHGGRGSALSTLSRAHHQITPFYRLSVIFLNWPYDKQWLQRSSIQPTPSRTPACR